MSEKARPRNTLLLVEDDPNDLFLFRRAVAKAGFEVDLKEVRDGEMAVEYLAARGKYPDRLEFPMPDLLLLDLKLPRKSGLETLAWIRAQESLRLLPVVVFTSSRERRDVERAYALGANSYLVKPTGNDGMGGMVKLILQYWLGANERG